MTMQTHDGAARARNGRRRAGAVLGSLADAAAELRRPFVAEAHEFLCTSTNERHNPTRGLVVPYVKVAAVERRLDEVVGPEHWEVGYRESNPGEFAVLCRLEILGVAKESYGQGGGPWAMEANAFKRAARRFGIGRYLTELEGVWAPIGKDTLRRAGRGFVVTDEYAAQLRPALAERIRRTYVPRYGEPLETYEEPGAPSDEGDLWPLGNGGEPAVASENGAGRGGGIEAVSQGPGADHGQPPAHPSARRALAEACGRAVYGDETLRGLSRLCFGSSIPDRLGEAELGSLAARVEAACEAKIGEPELAERVEQALAKDDRAGAVAGLDEWIESRRAAARESGDTKEQGS